LQRLEHPRVGVHDGSESCDGGDHVEEVAHERPQDRAQTRADAIARGRVQDRQGTRSGNELEYDDRGDETAVVLDIEHRPISGSGRMIALG
jgi:hypothetical protein